MNEPIYIENMRALRARANYTQAEVSQKLNIQRQTYCNYENGLRTPPPGIFIGLAELYNVTVDYLMRGTQERSAGALRALREDEQELLDAFLDLSDNDRKEVRDFILFKKMFPS